MKQLIPHDENVVHVAETEQRLAQRIAAQKEKEVDVLARTIWGEARGEGSAGMTAVANVIVNRLRVSESHDGGFWWGNTIEDICRKPYQFSAWNTDDPNFNKMKTVDDADIHFATAVRIARRAIYTDIADITASATHYHAAGTYPYWMQGERPVAVIGRHIFYALVPVG